LCVIYKPREWEDPRPPVAVASNKNKRNTPITNLNKTANFVTWYIELARTFFIYKMLAVSRSTRKYNFIYVHTGNAVFPMSVIRKFTNI